MFWLISCQLPINCPSCHLNQKWQWPVNPQLPTMSHVVRICNCNYKIHFFLHAEVTPGMTDNVCTSVDVIVKGIMYKSTTYNMVNVLRLLVELVHVRRYGMYLILLCPLCNMQHAICMVLVDDSFFVHSPSSISTSLCDCFILLHQYQVSCECLCTHYNPNSQSHPSHVPASIKKGEKSKILEYHLGYYLSAHSKYSKKRRIQAEMHPSDEPLAVTLRVLIQPSWV